MGMTTTKPVQAGPQIGAYFGLPGITRKFSQRENNDSLATTLAQATATTVTGQVPFKQTDVVFYWELQLKLAQTLAAGTQTITASPYFPYNYLGATTLQYQNTFPAINVQSGIDLALFQSYRPMRQTDSRNVLYTNFTNAKMYSNQTDLVSAGNYTSASTSMNLRFELPGGLWMQRYYDLKADGTILNGPLHTFVSPQFMAGSARIVQPQITYNPAFAGTGDQGPYTISGTPTTPATATGLSATMAVRRVGIYQPSGPQDTPPIYNWQYVRKSTPYSISGRTQVDIPVPFNGQVLSLFARGFDPTLNSGAGGIIPLANITKCQIVYGPGLPRFDDVPTDTQARFVSQHNFLPTDGVLIWDLAIDDEGNISNADALNTLNTSGVTIHLEFTGAQSASAYYVVGVEGLQYAEQ